MLTGSTSELFFFCCDALSTSPPTATRAVRLSALIAKGSPVERFTASHTSVRVRGRIRVSGGGRVRVRDRVGVGVRVGVRVQVGVRIRVMDQVKVGVRVRVRATSPKPPVPRQRSMLKSRSVGGLVMGASEELRSGDCSRQFLGRSAMLCCSRPTWGVTR